MIEDPRLVALFDLGISAVRLARDGLITGPDLEAITAVIRQLMDRVRGDNDAVR